MIGIVSTSFYGALLVALEAKRLNHVSDKGQSYFSTIGCRDKNTLEASADLFGNSVGQTQYFSSNVIPTSS